MEQHELERNRTHLANERTLLAYFRTSLAFFAIGALMIKFLPNEYLPYAIAPLFFGFGLLLYGSRKFIRNKKKIEKKYRR